MASPFKFKRGPSARLNGVAIEDGSIIITKDTKQLFVDIGTNRYSVGPDAATDDDIISMFNGAANAATVSETGDGTTHTMVINGSDKIEVTDF